MQTIYLLVSSFSLYYSEYFFLPDLANLFCSCKTFLVLANKWMVVVFYNNQYGCHVNNPFDDCLSSTSSASSRDYSHLVNHANAYQSFNICGKNKKKKR